MKINVSIQQAVWFHVVNIGIIATAMILGMVLGITVLWVGSMMGAGMYLKNGLSVLYQAIYYPNVKSSFAGIYDQLNAIRLKKRRSTEWLTMSLFHHFKKQFCCVRPLDFIFDSLIILLFMLVATTIVSGVLTAPVILISSISLCGISGLLLPYCLYQEELIIRGKEQNDHLQIVAPGILGVFCNIEDPGVVVMRHAEGCCGRVMRVLRC